MTARAEQATSWLADKQRAMEDALAPLVEVNSYTENPEGGRQVGAALRALFDIDGMTAAIHASQRFADHLVFRSRAEDAKVGAGGNRGAVALVGHLDTVFPPGAFEGYRRDGELARGPGVLDMKGGLVVVAFALRALAATGGLATLAPAVVVVVSDEEVGSPEGHAVIADAIAGSSACLVFEAGRRGDAIITRRKGTGAMTAVAHGRAAHAGNAHDQGHNAIWAVARFIDGVQRLTEYDRGITVNVGRVVGGQSKNTVPDRAEAQVDLRFCTRADGDELVTAVQRAAQQAAASVPGTHFELSGGVARMPLERSLASVKLCSEYAACARAHGLGGEEAPLIGGGSDASTAAGLGIPAIDGLGPRGSGFHTRDEHIEIASLVPKAQALARFLATRQPS